MMNVIDYLKVKARMKMNRCPKCGRPMVTNIHWSCGMVCVEWYCFRCSKAIGICTTYSTSNTKLKEEE